MLDQKAWLSACSRFEAFRENLPTYITEERVTQYHAIIFDLQIASGEFLNEFRIPDDKVKPKDIGGRRRGYSGGPGITRYSKDKYCDPDYFTGQVEALWRYLQGIVGQQMPTSSKAMAVRQPSSSTSIHVENMYGSNFQHSSPGAVANPSYQANYHTNDPQLLNLIGKIKDVLETIHLSPLNVQEVNADISTVQAQLSRPQPKATIIAESLRSIRSVLEGAAGSILAPHIVHEISKYLG